MQIKEQQKDKRTNSFIRRSDNKQDNNFNNVRQRTHEMVETKKELSYMLGELDSGKMVDNKKIIDLLDFTLKDKGINPIEIDSLKNEYITNLRQGSNGCNFIEKLFSKGIEGRSLVVLLMQCYNFSRFIDYKLKAMENGDMLNDEDMKMLFNAMMPGDLNSYENFKLTLVNHKDTEDLLKNLGNLGVGNNVLSILRKQSMYWNKFIEEKLECLGKGEFINNKYIETLFDILPDSLNVYEEYKNILVKKEDPKNLIDKLNNNGLSENICNLLIRQFENRQKIAKVKNEEKEEFLKALYSGEMVDNKKIIDLLDFTLKDKGINPIEIDSLKNEYITNLRQGSNGVDFIKNLSSMQIIEINDLLSMQFNNFSRFIDYKLKAMENGDMLNDEDMKMLFNAMMPGDLNSYENFKLTLVNHKGTEDLLKNLEDLGVDNNVLSILRKQSMYLNEFIEEKLKCLGKGEFINNKYIETLFDILPDSLNVYEEYKNILVKKEDPKNLIYKLKNNGLSENICNLLIKQFENRQKIAKVKNEETEKFLNALDSNEVVDNKKIIDLLDFTLKDKGINPIEIDSLKNEYITNLRQGSNGVDFIKKLISKGIEGRSLVVLLMQCYNFSRFIDYKLKAMENGDMLNDEDMKMLFNAMMPGDLNSYENFKLTLVNHKGTEDLLKNLGDLGVDNNVLSILRKQSMYWNEFIEEKLECLDKGEFINNKYIETLFNILPDNLNVYEEYKNILAKQGDPKNLIDKLNNNGLSENICNLLIRQFENRQKIAKVKNEEKEEFLKALYSGEMLDNKKIIDLLDFTLKDKGINPIEFDSLKNEYITNFRQGSNGVDFIKNLSSMQINEINDLLSMQFNNFSRFVDDKLKAMENGDIIDDEDIKILLSMITSSKVGDDLYEKYQYVLNEKDDEEKLKKFSEDLLSNEDICRKIYDIIWGNISYKLKKIYDGKSAEERPSLFGNLIVPESAKFSIRTWNRKKLFVGELHPIGYYEKTTLHGVLHNYFDEFVIKPITDANNILSEYIKKGFKIEDFPGDKQFDIRNAFKEAFKEEISKETIEKLKKWLDEKVNDGTVKSLNDILKNDIKALGYIAEKLNNQIKIMTPDEFEDKNNIIDKTLKEIEDKNKQIISKFPSNEDLINFMKCVVLSDTIKNGRNSRDLSASYPELNGAENSYRTPFYSLIMADHKGKDLTPEERVECKKDMLFNSLTKAANPLFSHKPCAADINQGGLGNCYFLGALISLVNSPQYGPNFIMNMMKDNMDGTVTVRLYRASSDPAASEIDEKGNIKSLHPVYVRVYKHGITYSPDCALWVNILEQAYTVLGGNFVQYKIHGIYKSSEPYYGNAYHRKKVYERTIGNISSGYSYLSFMTLTGQVAYLYDISNSNDTKNIRDIYAYKNKYGGLFNFISNALNKGFPVTIAFNDSFNTKEGKRISTRHTYSVLKTVEENGRQYVVLINPHYGGETICCPIEKIENYTQNIDVCGEVL